MVKETNYKDCPFRRAEAIALLSTQSLLQELKVGIFYPHNRDAVDPLRHSPGHELVSQKNDFAVMNTMCGTHGGARETILPKEGRGEPAAVSYTHLTLPTILLV